MRTREDTMQNDAYTTNTQARKKKSPLVPILIILAVLAAAAFAAFKYYPGMKAKTEVENFFKNIEGIELSSYDGVDYDTLSKTLVVTNMVITPQENDELKAMRIERLELVEPDAEAFRKLSLSKGDFSKMPSFESYARDITITGFQGVFEDSPQTPAMGIETFRLAGIQKGSFGEILVQGLTFSIPEEGMLFSMDTFSSENINYQKIVDYINFALSGTNPQVAMSPNPITYDTMSLKGYRLAFAEFELWIENMEATNPVIDNGNTIDSVFKLTNLGADMEKIPDAEISEMFGFLGLLKPSLNMDMKAAMDVPSGHYDLSRSVIELVDQAVLSFNLEMDNFFMPALMDSMMNPYGAYEKARLIQCNIDFNFTNPELPDKILELIALTEGMEREEFREKILAEFLQGLDNPEIPDSIRQTMAPLADFIRDPKSLAISIQPTEPLAGEVFFNNPDPAAIFKDLNITLTVNQ